MSWWGRGRRCWAPSPSAMARASAPMPWWCIRRRRARRWSASARPPQHHEATAADRRLRHHPRLRRSDRRGDRRPARRGGRPARGGGGAAGGRPARQAVTRGRAAGWASGSSRRPVSPSNTCRCSARMPIASGPWAGGGPARRSVISCPEGRRPCTTLSDPSGSIRSGSRGSGPPRVRCSGRMPRIAPGPCRGAGRRRSGSPAHRQGAPQAPLPVSVAGRKFIAGLPMKPAT